MFSSLLISLIFVLIIIYLCQFYLNVKKYPPGPLPYPIIGNLLMLLWNRKTHPILVIRETCHTYGKVSTFWFGSKPSVIIHDLETAKIAFNNVDFSGRPVTSISSIHCCESYSFKDYSDEVRYLRKLSFDAIRELSSSNQTTYVIRKVVNETVEKIKSIENNSQYLAQAYIPQIIIQILAELIFGRSYNHCDEELKFIQNSYEIFNNEITKQVLADFFPISRFFIKINANNKSQLDKLSNLHRSTFEVSQKSYQPENRDNCVNCMLSARNKLEKENRDSLQYLTDKNLIATLGTMFIGAVDSSNSTFKWLYLILAHYPDIQKKLREEVNKKLGKDDPKIEDRKNLDYVNAFIHELLRFRPIVPLGFFHKTMKQTTLSDFKIPKNTIILIDQYAFLNDKKYWKHPSKFMPERYLDSNWNFISRRSAAYIPFGTGKRRCVGEKLAINMIFITLVCLLQATDGYQFALPYGPQSDDLYNYANNSPTLQPKPYNIILRKFESIK